jgi:alkylhydroperoxidase family enzyme
MNPEPRIPRTSVEDAPAELRPTYETFVRERGKVPNLFRVAAHAPRLTARLAALNAEVMGQGEVPVLLKELLSTRVSHINLCDY